MNAFNFFLVQKQSTLARGPIPSFEIHGPDLIFPVQHQDYDGARQKKAEMDELRESYYRDLAVSELLEFPSPSRRNSIVGRGSNFSVLPPPVLHKTKPLPQQLLP